MDELSLAILWLHFLTLRKWNKAISEVEAYGASEEIVTKEGDPIRPKIQYVFTVCTCISIPVCMSCMYVCTVCMYVLCVLYGVLLSSTHSI